MEEFSVQKEFEQEIENIWNNEAYTSIEVLKRGYVIIDNVLINSTLFIGINPSFNDKKEKPLKEFYKIMQEGGNHKYFKKFEEISLMINDDWKHFDRLHFDWTHFDVLFFRETNQKYIQNELLKTPEGIAFLKNQLCISQKVICKAKPKIIVVSNTMARLFMGFEKNEITLENSWMGFDFEFDEDLGTHKIINTKLAGTPVFFTSMLTGQRALDNGSFKRLTWHIKLVLNKLNSV